MDIKTFVHSEQGSPTTLSEISRVHEIVGSEEFVGVFAYATQSGVAAFDLQFGNTFWEATRSRWLFGIDYGRTQPKALRSMCEKDGAEIRIVDGRWVSEQAGFIPRRDFHAKMAVMLNRAASRVAVVVGSGNFSSNGLRKNIEAGASIVARIGESHAETLMAKARSIEHLWAAATPVEEILSAYEDRWIQSFSRTGEALPRGEVERQSEFFWIEAGYVTRNRGPNRPGNQIDFPRGTTARYFGFDPPDDLPPNSVIGPVTFETPSGRVVTNNLRLGNNLMEKISLPIPEEHGFDIYDGKVLIFQRQSERFFMRVVEASDFETAFGDRLSAVRVMGSGRRYGHLM